MFYAFRHFKRALLIIGSIFKKKKKKGKKFTYFRQADDLYFHDVSESLKLLFFYAQLLKRVMSLDM